MKQYPRLMRLKHQIEYAVFLGVQAIFRTLPIEAASAIAGLGWRLLAPLTPRHKRAIGHLRAAFPDKPLAECDAIARAMWQNLGRVFAEFFHLDEIAASDRIEPRDVQDVLNQMGDDRRAVVCSAHFGNWEIATMIPIRLGFRPVGVYQRVSNPLVDAFVERHRAPYYPMGLVEKSATAGVQGIRAIHAGGCAAMLADLRESAGIAVPFFGRPAPSTSFPAHLARSMNVPLLASIIVRDAGVRFHLVSAIIDVPRTDNRDADVAQATASLHAWFERHIREHPEQWMWAHRRWG